MRVLPILLFLLVPTWSALSAPPQPADDSAVKQLQASAESFVKAFNSHDPTALAALMTPDGELVRDDGSRISGREAVGAFYANLFKTSPKTKVGLDIISLQFPSENCAIEEGVLHVTESLDGTPASFAYSAVHVKQADGTWLVAQNRDKPRGRQPAREALAGIDGLVGEWIAKLPEGSMRLGFEWDESGSYLVGKSVSTVARYEPELSTLRIGWDPARERIVSWNFDSRGGFSKQVWTDTGNRWVIKANGYTAAGEITSSTQILQPTSDDSFTWSITDEVIGEQEQTEQRLDMVRRPPEPQTTKN